MELSIVSGTYNRLRHMQRMVASVRNSIGVGLDYEIVLVDGGSSDGTIEWCEQQEDIKLIQQGELLGAVKAFNAGCYAAVGDYVVIANDDIEFVGFSILAAYIFMQDHKNVGVGCFYQDRNNKNMHVETMPAVVDGKQKPVYYGQVCIVPKTLGDSVGWWGDYNHTYGGDNELSCNIWELGYRVVPIECACIHDFQIDDDLREANNGYPQQLAKTGKMHPDTQRWRDKWTHANGYLGPIVGSKRVTERLDAPKRLYRIYYAPIYESGHELQHKTKKTLREALQKLGVVFECDYIKESVDYILDSVYAFKPDLILLQAQNAGDKFNVDTVTELRELCPNAKLVMWNGDYHPRNLTNLNYINMLKLFDLCGFATTKFAELYDAHGLNWMYLQAGFEDYPEADEPVLGNKWDFVFLGNGYSDYRKRLAKTILSTGYNVGLYGMWPKNIESQGDTLYDYAKNYQIYNSAKFAISDQQWPDAVGYVSDRIFHAMRSGVCVLQQWFEGAEELMGLIDYENIIFWDDLKDLKATMNGIIHSMKDDDYPNASDYYFIGKEGQRYIKEQYHYDNFVDRMLEALGYE